jgi:hypothetical protein
MDRRLAARSFVQHAKDCKFGTIHYGVPWHGMVERISLGRELIGIVASSGRTIRLDFFCWRRYPRAMEFPSLRWLTLAIVVSMGFCCRQELQAQPAQDQTISSSEPAPTPHKKSQSRKQSKAVKKTSKLSKVNSKNASATKLQAKAPSPVKSSEPLPEVPLTPFVPQNP